MNITKSDFLAIEQALRLLPQGPAFMALSDEEQAIISEADRVMMALYKKGVRNNKRTAQYIANKRKDDPNYARSKKAAREKV